MNVLLFSLKNGLAFRLSNWKFLVKSEAKRVRVNGRRRGEKQIPGSRVEFSHTVVMARDIHVSYL